MTALDLLGPALVLAGALLVAGSRIAASIDRSTASDDRFNALTEKRDLDDGVRWEIEQGSTVHRSVPYPWGATLTRDDLAAARARREPPEQGT